MHSEEFLQKMKTRLNEEKETIQEELSELNAHTEMGDDDDDNASEREVDEVNRDIIAQLKSDLVQIEQALANMEKGTYGLCAVGGEDISEQRLEVLPWADRCVEHQNA